MSFINKQKFLAELGRLLTFMYEEDRLTALAEYERMFETASNEQLLIQLLVSPTKQAVMLARSYEAKDRKLQIKSDSRSTSQGERPEFMTVLDRIRSEVFSKLPAENTQAQSNSERSPAENSYPSPDETENQLSIFDEASQQSELSPATQEQSESSPTPVTARKTAPSIASSGEIISDIALTMREIEQQSLPSLLDDESLSSEEAPTDNSYNEPPLFEMDFGFADDLSFMQNYLTDESAAPVSTESEQDLAEPMPSAEESEQLYPLDAEDEVSSSHEDNSYEPLEFDYTLSDNNQPASEEAPAVKLDTQLETTAAEPADETPIRHPPIGISSSTETKANDYLNAVEDEQEDEPEKELKPLILVLYLLLAIPLGLFGIVFLLLPSFLCLTLGIGLGFFAVLVLGALSSGFVVLADMLAVGGAGLLLLALTLLMLWLFVWFIGGAIVGLIRALISLGGKLCLKEVSEE